MTVAQRGTLWELIMEAKELLEVAEGPDNGGTAEYESWVQDKTNWFTRFAGIERDEAEDRDDAKTAQFRTAYGGSPAEDAERGREPPVPQELSEEQDPTTTWPNNVN